MKHVRFPVVTPTLIKCPICNGKGCNVCNWTGEYEMESEAYVEVQQPLVVKYLVENQSTLSSEISRLYGAHPEITTEKVIKNYEIVRIDSLSGSVWIAYNLKEVEAPRYFYKLEEVEKWLA